MKGVIIMKNERILRFVCSFLTAIMLLSSLAACAETKPSEETTAAENNAGTLTPVASIEETTSDPTLDAQGYLKDDLPEDLKFNDELTLLVWDDVEHEEFNIEYEKLSGDIVEQSLYDRNSKA